MTFPRESVWLLVRPFFWYTPPFRSLTGKKRQSGSNATDNNLSSRPLTTSYIVPSDKENFVGRAKISRLSFLPVSFPHVARDLRFHNCASALEEHFRLAKLHVTWRTSRKIRIKYIERFHDVSQRRVHLSTSNNRNRLYKFNAHYYYKHKICMWMNGHIILNINNIYHYW